MLKKLVIDGESKRFSVNAPLAIAKELEDYAYAMKMTQSAFVTLLLGKALKAEKGGVYTPEERKVAAS